jgi:thioredoxin reductase (NADPH)
LQDSSYSQAIAFLERPRVFAVGNVRSASLKRVDGASGEGAAAVALIHQYLTLAA